MSTHDKDDSSYNTDPGSLPGLARETQILLLFFTCKVTRAKPNNTHITNNLALKLLTRLLRRAAEEEKKRIMRKRRIAVATSELELLRSIPAKDLPKLDLVKKIAGIGGRRQFSKKKTKKTIL